MGGGSKRWMSGIHRVDSTVVNGQWRPLVVSGTVPTTNWRPITADCLMAGQSDEHRLIAHEIEVDNGSRISAMVMSNAMCSLLTEPNWLSRVQRPPP